jgi:hypothetical protein
MDRKLCCNRGVNVFTSENSPMPDSKRTPIVIRAERVDPEDEGQVVGADIVVRFTYDNGDSVVVPLTRAAAERLLAGLSSLATEERI